MIDKPSPPITDEKIEKIINNPSFKEAIDFLNFGKAYQETKEPDSAIKTSTYWKNLLGSKQSFAPKELRKLLKDETKSVRTAAQQCILAHDITRDGLDKAEAETLEKELNKFENPNPIVTGYCLNLMGDVYARLDLASEAIDCLEKITPNMGKEYHKATLELLITYDRNQDFEKALQLNQSVIDGQRCYLSNDHNLFAQITSLFHDVTGNTHASFPNLDWENGTPKKRLEFISFLLQFAQKLNQSDHKSLNSDEIEQMDTFFL